MEKNGGGWTVIQRRMNGHINFSRDWDSYKRGFGNMKGEHWLGNDHLHQLTSKGKYMLRIDMSDFGNSKRHAVYSKFSVGSESSGYKLDITGYSGDAGTKMGTDFQRWTKTKTNLARTVLRSIRVGGGVVQATRAT
ncbi:Hypothetical predicted protein [Mytilus galloprovincialis]|uniref:Fibrinogen C-terminal domain-containing protein n=1 Tax=Mytilus galloprovincialis TaxID=29158 RepID=A0A8B6GLN2_MYTGA|nr:Hypothetical predicted protein [Mytilus galloprovincialis]